MNMLSNVHKNNEYASGEPCYMFGEIYFLDWIIICSRSPKLSTAKVLNRDSIRMTDCQMFRYIDFMPINLP